MDVTHSVQQNTRLSVHGLDDRLGSVAEQGHAERPGEVEQDVAVDVAHVAATRLLPEHRPLVRHVRDVVRLDGPEPPRGLARLRARWSDPDVRK